MTTLDSLLHTFLIEESHMSENEFFVLTEEVKENFAKEIMNEILNNIKTKLSSLDLFSINKTRGEIKNFIDLNVIQDSVNKLKNLVLKNVDNINSELLGYINEIITTIVNLNKYSYLFKEAYRNKKTILILRYQSIILAIVSALSYLISVSVDFKDIHSLKLKPKISLEEIAPIKSIIEFNKSVENGTFLNNAKDVETLREWFSEYSVKEISTIYEAVNIVDLINTGITSFSNFLNNNSRNTLLLKVLGIITIVLSLRQTFYSLAASKNKFSDYLNSLKTFLNIEKIPSLSAISRFITFNNKNVIDAETSTKVAQQEIDSENKEIIQNVKTKPTEVDELINYVPQENSGEAEPSKDEDIFANFNF